MPQEPCFDAKTEEGARRPSARPTEPHTVRLPGADPKDVIAPTRPLNLGRRALSYDVAASKAHISHCA